VQFVTERCIFNQ